MSYWIEYQAACFVIPQGLRGVRKDRFVIACEGGSNNLTERVGGRERRVREWYVGMIGTPTQVLRQAVRVAGDCEGTSLRLNGRHVKPEAYIARTRRLLTAPRDSVTQHVTLRATVKRDHPLVARARLFGLPEQTFERFGEALVHLNPLAGEEGPDWEAFFRVVDPFIDDETALPHQLGQIWHLPAS